MDFPYFVMYVCEISKFHCMRTKYMCYVLCMRKKYSCSAMHVYEIYMLHSVCVLIMHITHCMRHIYIN